jgi:hypothetical protein
MGCAPCNTTPANCGVRSNGRAAPQLLAIYTVGDRWCRRPEATDLQPSTGGYIAPS